MKKFIKKIVLMIFMALTTQVVAEERLLKESQKLDEGAHRGFIEKHDAIETTNLRISLKKNNHGIVEGKSCATCKTMVLNVTPETKAFRGTKEVPLRQAKGRLGRYATVIFELDTKNVSQIHW